jgi:hypothetical protein
MGGFGSGRWSTRAYIDDCLAIDIWQWWRQDKCLRRGVSFAYIWETGEQNQSIGVDVEDHHLVLKYQFDRGGIEREEIEVPIQVVWTPCPYGGRRPWFECPACRKRAAKLYLLDATARFVCRSCCELPYQSQSESRTTRAARTAMRLRRQLQIGETESLETLLRPKGMHRSPFERLKRRLIEAETIRLSPLQKWLEKRQ